MIKINLIPVKRKKKPRVVPPFVVAMVLLLVVSGVAVAYYNSYKAGQIEDLQKQKQANEQKLKELEKRVKEVKNFEKLNARVTKRKEIIEQLTKNQSIPVIILDEMSKNLTKGIWLKSMSISGTKIKVAGVGFSNTDIVSFVQQLKGSEYFVNVELQGTTRKMEQETETYNFNLILEIKA
ncbi:MAG: PilN domain-containing protein [Nitrospirota bacterium]|jgi:type IV pilus assembly protein PilN